MGLFVSLGSCVAADADADCRWEMRAPARSRQLLLFAQMLLAEYSAAPSEHTTDADGTRRLRLARPADAAKFARQYRAQLYNAHGEPRVPAAILNCRGPEAREFLSGYEVGACWRQGDLQPPGKELAAGLWLLAAGGGFSRLSRSAAGFEVRRGRGPAPAAQSDGVLSVEALPAQGLGQAPSQVYDLETASGHFHVGPGDLVVHNTDSLYLTCPSRFFVEADAAYAAGALTREDWWAAMVRITMRVMASERDAVNANLREDNGTGFLKMAYEEVLFPVVFTGKKKYFGVGHESVVNLRPKKLFVRGIDVVKMGVSGLAREIGTRIMWACVAPDNRRAVRAITEDVLREAVQNPGQWDFEHFVKSDAWKPHKDNKTVQRFVARMRARLAAGGDKRLYALPEPGERFRYVLVRTPDYDLRGCKSAAKIGDRMEYAAAARAVGLEVDVALYLTNYVVGLCARFINGDPDFVAGGDPATQDKKAQDAAKKALDLFLRGLGGLDP